MTARGALVDRSRLQRTRKECSLPAPLGHPGDLLAVHFDGTWNSPTVTSNLVAVLRRVDVDVEWLYAAGGYVASIHREFGRLPMRSFPNLTIRQLLRWSAIRGIMRIRPRDSRRYGDETAQAYLADEHAWEDHGDYPTDEQTLERLRPLFWGLSKLARAPASLA